MTVRVRPYLKDPDEVLDFRWDWGADRLLSGETIVSSVFEVTPGITVDSTSNDTTSATVWLSGGTIGISYYVTNRVTTDQGRTYDWTIIVSVRQR